jgi:putative ABC transport system substrate-binding protein
MIDRRRLVIALGAVAAALPRVAFAQPSRKLPVIGFLHPGFAADATSVAMVTNLRAGLREAGYLDGKSIGFEFRWADGKADALPRVARELVQRKVDVLAAIGPSAVTAARAATTTIPIVATDLETDPVAAKLAASLARPGGNVTGIFLNHADLTAKWLQMLLEVAPGARRVDVLWDSNTGPYQRSAIAAAARAMSIGVEVLEFADASGIEGALENGLKRKPQALVLLGSPLINARGSAIARFATRHRLPGIAPFRSFSAAGGLMSYGPDLDVMFRSLGARVAKILKGAKPGESPIEPPSRFELVVNSKAAAALGIKLPQALLARADEVILP